LTLVLCWAKGSGLESGGPVGLPFLFHLIRVGATPPSIFKDWAMAKPTTVKIRLVSTAETGFFYVTKKNPRTQTEKMSMRKYDPVVRKHVDFKEAKIK